MIHFNRGLLCLVLIVAVLSNSYGQRKRESFRCNIIGEVIDRPFSETLLINNEMEDLRIAYDSVKIHNGKFNLTFDANYGEAYTLAFTDELANGTWRPILFFVDSDTIMFTLYSPEQQGSNRVVGGDLNKEYYDMRVDVERLFGFAQLERRERKLIDEGQFYSAEAIELMKQIEETEDTSTRDSLGQVGQTMTNQGTDLSVEGRALRRAYTDNYSKSLQWRAERVVFNPSLVSYRELVQLLEMADSRVGNPVPFSVNDLIASFERDYQRLYPNHAYTRAVEVYLEKSQKIRTGGEYIDFTTMDFDGNMVTLSDVIKGKVALINLWASWCGPCRRKGIEMIPIYEEFKNAGFEVIGVARERQREHGIKAADADGYPWLNLLELGDSQNIWGKYGIQNSGGGMFLVNENGKIEAISPTAEEVREYLKQRLN